MTNNFLISKSLFQKIKFNENIRRYLKRRLSQNPPGFPHPTTLTSRNTDFTFIPKSIPGKSANPKLKGEACKGMDLRYLRNSTERERQINLDWLLFAYKNYPEKEEFFARND